MSDTFRALAHRCASNPDDDWSVGRLSAALNEPYETVRGYLHGRAVPDATYTRMCTIVAEYERNKARYREWKKGHGK